MASSSARVMSSQMYVKTDIVTLKQVDLGPASGKLLLEDWRGLRSERVAETQTNLAWDAFLPLDGGSYTGPLHARLTSAIRDAIRTGRIPVGSALPPTRTLALDLGCSRWVVTEAYEQLVAEGYLEARVGSGTRVRLYDLAPSTPAAVSDGAPPMSRFDLSPGLPDFHSFPRALWLRAMRDAITSMPDAEFDYQAPGGHPRLRGVIATYLRRVRGAVVRADDVTITSGILDGITLLSRALVAAGRRRVVVEDPTWNRVVETTRLAGLNVVPVAVDVEGLRTDLVSDLAVETVITAPAHQFPTGMVLTPERRLVLLEWSRYGDGLILEDDYDAEFRYDRRPVGTLQGIDPAHVALFGSVSKTLAPAVGIGWVVTPPRWTEAIRSVEVRLTGPSVLDQLTLTRFIETGDYDRHLRAVRRGYRLLRDRFVTAIGKKLPGCNVMGASAGLHVLVGLPRGVTGAAVAEVAASRGIRLKDLEDCRAEPSSPTGLKRAGRKDTGIPDEGIVLGYGSLTTDTIGEAVDELARIVGAVQTRPSREHPSRVRETA